MHSSSAAFEPYLAPEESVVEAVRCRFADGSEHAPGVVCVTDRRLLLVTDGGSVRDVAHGAICSIGSHRRWTWTAAGVVYPLLAVAGVVVAALAVVGLVNLRPDAVTVALLIVAVGGAAAAEWLRRESLALTPEAVHAIPRLLGGTRPTDLQYVHRGEGVGLVVATAVGSLLGLVGLVVVTGSLAVVPLTLLLLVGLAVADVASRRTRRLHARGGSRRESQVVSVDLVNGRTVDLAVPEGRPIDRVLMETVRGPVGEHGSGSPRAARVDVAASPD